MRKKIILSLLLLLPTWGFSNIHFNGISSYEQLNKEYYLGALYTVVPMTDTAEILADNRPQKMVIKVTTRRWSPRKFNEIWRQDLAMNNDLGADLALTTHILEFTNLPQDNLTVGDELVIDFRLADGTTIWLNGQQLMQANGKDLFNALLKTWIGDVPPSRLFRSDILNQESIVTSSRDELSVRFDQLSVQAERADIVAQWQSLEQQAELALAQAEEELRLQQEQEEQRRREAAAEQRRLEQERQAALALAEQRRREAEEERQRAAQAAQAASSSNATDSTSASNNTAAANEEARRLAAQREAERRAAEQRAAELAAAQEQERQAQIASQYALDLYRWQVLEDVYKRVSYPEWARQFNQQGIVTVEFIVNRSGQLIGVTGITPEDSGLLGQELRDAVRLSAPFNSFPAEIEANQLRIAIDYNFSLRERVAELPPKPEPPEGLSTELTDAQKTLQWVSYQEQIRSRIAAEIQYPFWAQDLKQEGKVVANVTLNRDGSVTGVELTQKARHAILNQEVEQAIARLGNLSAFPDWVSDNSLTLEIEHNFKL